MNEKDDDGEPTIENVVGGMLEAQVIMDTADIKKVMAALAGVGTEPRRRRPKRKKSKKD